MKLFKSKLRKKIEFYIEMARDSLVAIDKEMDTKRIKRTLNPAVYSHYAVLIHELKHDIELLKELL